MGRLPVRLRLKDFRSSFWHERKAQAKTLSHLQETAALALQELPAGYLQTLLPQAHLARQAVSETTRNDQ
jgi:hypothetical protein